MSNYVRASGKFRRVQAYRILTGLLGCLTLLTLSACGGLSHDLTTESVVGSWTAQYLDGHVDLQVMADGRYSERIYGFTGQSGQLLDENNAGPWSIEDGWVVLP